MGEMLPLVYLTKYSAWYCYNICISWFDNVFQLRKAWRSEDVNRITDNTMVKWKMKKNNDTSEAVDHRQYNGQMKNEKEQWYIRSCKSQKIQWSSEKWKRTMIHQKL